MIISEQAANQMNVQDRFAAPSPEHPFGTDNFGRDVFARTLLGVRISLYVGLSSVLISSAVGVLSAGSLGYASGAVDDLIMRTMDILMSFPPILVAMTITAVIGPTLNNAILALGLVYIPYFARVTRSEAISVAWGRVRQAPKRSASAGPTSCSGGVAERCRTHYRPSEYRHLLRDSGGGRLQSFLGLGAQPPTPSWGLMLQQAKQYLAGAVDGGLPGLRNRNTVLGFNLLTEPLRSYVELWSPPQQGSRRGIRTMRQRDSPIGRYQSMSGLLQAVLGVRETSAATALTNRFDTKRLVCWLRCITVISQAGHTLVASSKQSPTCLRHRHSLRFLQYGPAIVSKIFDEFDIPQVTTYDCTQEPST